jgi:hypothetical protein
MAGRTFKRKEYLPLEVERNKIASGIHEGVKKTSPSSSKRGAGIPTRRANEGIKSFITRLQAYDARRRVNGRLVQTDVVHPTGRNPVPRTLGKKFVTRRGYK